MNHQYRVGKVSLDRTALAALSCHPTQVGPPDASGAAQRSSTPFPRPRADGSPCSRGPEGSAQRWSSPLG